MQNSEHAPHHKKLQQRNAKKRFPQVFKQTGHQNPSQVRKVPNSKWRQFSEASPTKPPLRLRSLYSYYTAIQYVAKKKERTWKKNPVHQLEGGSKSRDLGTLKKDYPSSSYITLHNFLPKPITSRRWLLPRVDWTWLKSSINHCPRPHRMDTKRPGLKNLCDWFTGWVFFMGNPHFFTRTSMFE